jgi:hypothetical protein
MGTVSRRRETEKKPHMDLMDVDVHAVYPLNYDQLIDELRKAIQVPV